MVASFAYLAFRRRPLAWISTVAGVVAPVSIRVNPDVDAKTHPYISTGLRDNKFGIAFDRAPDVYKFAQSLPNLNVQGIDCHIGSQLTNIDPFIDATDRLLALIDDLKAQGINIRHLDVGGGLGVVYRDELPPQPSDYAKALLGRLENHQDLELIFEPGRAIAANAGILLTRVEFLKHTEHKNFAIIDAAMNDLMRPALYDAWHDIVPVSASNNPADIYDIVGPVCESGDWLGKKRNLTIEEGSLLAILSAGAYGMSMSSNYNSRPRVAEVMVDGARRAMRATFQREMDHLERHLAFLASTGSVSPYVGLFGTVWGVYHALVAIGQSGQGTLDKVAGPVGEALIMTAFGLAVAIPAVLGYNTINRNNRLVVADLNRFANDLLGYFVTGARVAHKE